METVYAYFLKSAIAMILFYGFYRLMIFQNTYFKVRRFTLLAIIAFSVFFPFIRFSFGSQSSGLITSVISERPVFELPEVVIEVGKTSLFPFSYWLIGGYLLVTGCLLIRIIIGLIAIVKLRRKASYNTINGVTVLMLNDITAPFSFFNWIFFTPDKKDTQETSQILLHESTHARQYHSLDSILCELLTAFFWFNPFAWLLKQEVRVNLELLADENVIRSGAEVKSYQYALLRLCHPVKINKLVNNFNVSQFKRRIIMMDKKRSSHSSLWRYLFLLPVALFLVIACNEGGDELVDKQNDVKKSVSALSSVKESVSDVFTVVEDMPVFPGGQTELMKFIGENLKYPQSAIEKSIQGRVIASFVVTKEGKVVDVNIVRGVNPEMDEEAIRVIESMPDWKPGYQKGIAVNVKYTIPINFRLTDDSVNSNKALVIIDGVEQAQGFDFKSISPDKIANISIKKGDEARNLYGEKGSNGVIVITLKD